MQPIAILHLLVLFYASPSVVAADGGQTSQASDCISGLMSWDKMDAIIRDIKTETTFPTQGIFPGMNFTCNGNIQRLIFGAKWQGDGSIFPELQIWRPNGNGSYNKVGGIPINVTGKNSSQLYQYNLSSPLAFQTGDILGYYKPEMPTSQYKLLLYLEYNGRGQIGHLYSTTSITSDLLVSKSLNISSIQVVMDVETDPPGCECGFMSEERMKILLGLETVKETPIPLSTGIQLISPDMMFTCNGTITKWIIAAIIRTPYAAQTAELQLWRKTTNGIYQKIDERSNTLIKAEQSIAVNEFKFVPISFQVGDILGVFIPSERNIDLYAINTNNTTNYIHYLDHLKIEIATISTISATPTYHHPMMSIEICTYNCSSATSVTSADIHSMMSLEITTIIPGISSSQVMTHDSVVTSSVEIVPSSSSGQYLSSLTTFSLKKHSTSAIALPSDQYLSSLTTSSFKKHLTSPITLSSLSDHYFGSVTTYQNVSLSINVSHPPDGEDGGITLTIIIATAVFLLVTVVIMIVVAVLVCVLQYKSKKAMDVQHKKQANEVYSGSNIYEIISQYRVAQPAPFQKSKTYKEQTNPFYESSVDSDVDDYEYETANF